LKEESFFVKWCYCCDVCSNVLRLCTVPPFTTMLWLYDEIGHAFNRQYRCCCYFSFRTCFVVE